MEPLIKCMDDDQKEKLDIIFEKDFERLNRLLSNNGFPNCKDFGQKSFKVSDGYIQLEETTENDESDTEEGELTLEYVSRPTLNDNDYFLPTQPSIKTLKSRNNTVNTRKKRKNYKTYSKILI